MSRVTRPLMIAAYNSDCGQFQCEHQWRCTGPSAPFLSASREAADRVPGPAGTRTKWSTRWAVTTRSRRPIPGRPRRLHHSGSSSQCSGMPPGRSHPPHMQPSRARRRAGPDCLVRRVSEARRAGLKSDLGGGWRSKTCSNDAGARPVRDTGSDSGCCPDATPANP